MGTYFPLFPELPIRENRQKQAFTLNSFFPVYFGTDKFNSPETARNRNMGFDSENTVDAWLVQARGILRAIQGSLFDLEPTLRPDELI